MYEKMLRLGHQELANKFMSAMASLIAGYGTQFQDRANSGEDESRAVNEAKNNLIMAGYGDDEIAMLENEAWERYL